MSCVDASNFSSERASSAPLRGVEERAGGSGRGPARKAEKAGQMAPEGDSSSDRRSGRESPTDPRPATVPLPRPRLGDSGPSRHVPGGEASKGERGEGCRGGNSGLPRELDCVAEVGERAPVLGNPYGVSPLRPARTSALPLGNSGAIPALHRRAPARFDLSSLRAARVSFGIREVLRRPLRVVRELAVAPLQRPRAAHLRSNPVRKSPVRNVPAERPP